MAMRLERSAAEIVLPVLHDMGAEVLVNSGYPLTLKAIDKTTREVNHFRRTHPLSPALYLEAGYEEGRWVDVDSGLINLRCANFYGFERQTHHFTTMQDPKTAVREVIARAFDAARFHQMVDRMGYDGWSVPLKGTPHEIVAMLQTRYRLVEAECESILRYLGRESLTGFGVHSAITRAAQDYDHVRARHMQNAAGAMVAGGIPAMIRAINAEVSRHIGMQNMAMRLEERSRQEHFDTWL
jgi:hypothetical protein